MDVTRAAKEFIRLTSERRRLQEEEQAVKDLLEEFFRCSSEKSIRTEAGTVSWIETRSVTWDTEALKRVLPARLWRTVVSVSVSNKLLEELIKKGEVAEEAVALCRREEKGHRLVAKASATSTAGEAPRRTPGKPAS